MISAACHQVIFFALVRGSTSQTFVIRAISERIRSVRLQLSAIAPVPLQKRTPLAFPISVQ
jgi:hypothetical protein